MIEETRNFTSQRQAVRLSDVSKSFGAHAVLKEINLTIGTGQSLCVYGPNAVGKTTLLRIAAGLVSIDSGSVVISGYDAKAEPQKARAAIGVISHKPMVYPQLTVIENLRFFASLYGVSSAEARIEQLMEQSGLGGYRYDCASVLSRGMLQRLAIARALVHSPSVLLADEPFTGLDADASKYLIGVFNDFTEQRRSIMMTTHNVGLSLKCCGRVAVLDGGRLIFEAGTGEIDNDKFARDYLSYARRVN